MTSIAVIQSAELTTIYQPARKPNLSQKPGSQRRTLKFWIRRYFPCFETPELQSPCVYIEGIMYSRRRNLLLIWAGRLWPAYMAVSAELVEEFHILQLIQLNCHQISESTIWKKHDAVKLASNPNFLEDC